MKNVITTIKRTPYQSLASFLALFLTLFLSLNMFFITSFLHGLLSYIESRPQVTVYFQNQTTESDISKIKSKLMDSNKILSVKHITKTDAFNIYKQMNKDNPLLLEMVSPDILPASLEIFAKKPSYLPEIAEFLKKEPGIDEVNFQKNIVDKLLTLTSIIRIASFIFVGFLVIYTTIILITITHFKAALKKDEIELLRLLGASSLYIKKPFLEEALFFGIISALIVFSIFITILICINPLLNSYLQGIPNINFNIVNYQLIVWPLNIVFSTIMLCFTVIFGISISTIATLLATQKYIK